MDTNLTKINVQLFKLKTIFEGQLTDYLDQINYDIKHCPDEASYLSVLASNLSCDLETIGEVLGAIARIQELVNK